MKKIEVFVQCVTRNSGSYDATFGYENENATALTVPIGSDNYFSPPPIDRAQTSTFQPGKVQSAFTVKGIPSGTKLTWTVNSGGRSDTATASESSQRWRLEHAAAQGHDLPPDRLVEAPVGADHRRREGRRVVPAPRRRDAELDR